MRSAVARALGRTAAEVSVRSGASDATEDKEKAAAEVGSDCSDGGGDHGNDGADGLERLLRPSIARR